MSKQLSRILVGLHRLKLFKALKDILFLVNFRLDGFIFKSTINKVHKTIKPQICTMYIQSS